MNYIKHFLTLVADFFDPYRQSFFFFKYKVWHILIIFTAILFVYSYRVTDAKYSADTSKGFIHSILDNPIVYLPNYLVHEFGHRITGAFAYRLLPGAQGCNRDKEFCMAKWVTTLAGNGTETMLPIVLLFLALRLRGGRMLTPFIMYWIATTFYGAARYASDARAKIMHLTSSDFISDFKPGEVNGDWHNILNPLGLMEYDIFIGKIFFFIAAFFLVMAVFSMIYYISHMDEILKHDITHGKWKKDKEKIENPEDLYKEPAMYFDEHSVIFEHEEIKDPKDLPKLK